MPTRLIVVPHCPSEFNDQRRLQGQLDSPLNERGRRQAANLAKTFAKVRVSAIYSSDLSRCVETARPLAASHQLEVTLHAGLRGRHYGVIQGMRYGDIQDKFPHFYQCLKRRDAHIRFCAPTEEGESLTEFEDRTMRAVLDYLGPYAEMGSPDATVVIVTHGGVVDCICRRARRLPMNLVVDDKLYDPVQNYFLFDRGEFRVCGPSWDLRALAG